MRKMSIKPSLHAPGPSTNRESPEGSKDIGREFSLAFRSRRASRRVSVYQRRSALSLPDHQSGAQQQKRIESRS